MPAPELEAILAAMFEAEFATPREKHAKMQARDALLQLKAEAAGIPWERLKLAIVSA